MNPIKIIIADDKQLIIDGIKSIIGTVEEFDIVAEAKNGQEAIDLLKYTQVDVVLMDVEMPVMNGIEAAKQIKKDYPEVKVLTLTLHKNPALIKTLAEAGASGYILKDIGQEELVRAIKEVAAGNTYFSAGVTESLLGFSSNPIFQTSDSFDKINILTKRETEILKLIAEGFSNTKIGEQLFISARTVDKHRTNMMKKLEVNNIAGLIRIAIQSGMVN